MLTNDELLAIIEAHRADSLGAEDGELSNERATALDRYHGRLYGNEMEGRSAVVSKDLSEAVDWVMPAIMRIFTQSGSIAEFGPVSQEDEAQAEIETDYVNQVIMKDNDGWIVLHDAIKDTLLLKNGYVKHFWDVTEKVEEPYYKGLSIEEVQKLMADLKQDGCEVEVKEHDSHEIQGPQGPIAVFDLKLKIKRTKGKVTLLATPAEEVRISRKCRGSLQESPFVEHVTRKTRSDLIEMGMDREFVDQLPTYESAHRYGSQSLSRDSVSDESSYKGGSSVNDRSMDEIEYCESYVRVDWDGDGVAELRKIVTVGHQIPEGEEWNEPVPAVGMTGFVAKRMPHRHVGESLYDELGDLQEIKTTLQRQLLDNIYLVNNSEVAVNELCNLADFMVRQPGGIKRISGMDPVGGAYQQFVTPNISGDILPVIGYIDSVKESRTGISKASAGLDPDTLSNVTKGAYMENMNRASQKVEMITRLIAETGVKELVLQVHSLLLRYQDKQRVVRMKGKYVNVNPQEWRERTDLTVKVGLGTGTEEQRVQKLMAIGQMQRDALGPVGLVGPKEAYALFADQSKAMGFDMPDKYAMDPTGPEYQQKMSQPQQPPLPIQIEQIKQQADVQKHQAETQNDIQKFQAETQMAREIEQIKAEAKLQETRAQLELQAANDARDSEREQMKAAFDAQLAAQQLELDRYKIDAEIAADARKAQLDSDTKLEVARMSHQATLATTEGAIVDQSIDRVGQVLSPIMQQIEGVKALAGAMHAQMMAPKSPRKIVRDPSGQIIGVDDGGVFTKVQRGIDGRIEGV